MDEKVKEIELPTLYKIGDRFIPILTETAHILLSEVKRLEGEVQTLEAKEIGLKKVIEEFKKINPHLETKIRELETSLKRLREGIEEVIDGTLPYLAEQRLKKLLEKE